MVSVTRPIFQSSYLVRLHRVRTHLCAESIVAYRVRLQTACSIYVGLRLVRIALHTMSTSTPAVNADGIDDLNKLEAAFYTSGYEAGFEHGRAHGIFEGRALGQEKGFETFEELHYYAGQARFWQLIAQDDIKKRKALPHILAILTMIDNFPTQNSSADPEPENDTEVLIQTIRSKYRVMCASLAIRPRLQKADMSL